MTEHHAAAIVEAARLLAGCTDWDKLSRQLLESARVMLGCEACSFSLPDDAGEALIIHSSQTELLGQFRTVPKGQGISWQVFESGESVLVEQAEAHPDHDHAASPVRTRSMMTIALKEGGRVFGVMQALNPEDGRVFTLEDLEALEAFGGLVAVTLQRLLAEREATKAAEDRLQLRLARQVTESFLPPREERSGGVGVRAWIAPADVCGGDFYFIERISVDRTVVGVGDVTGKGFPAALDMARASALLQTTSADLDANLPLQTWLELFNNRLRRLFSKGRGCALSVALIDAERREAECCACGQVVPRLWIGGKWEKIPLKPAPALGVRLDQAYPTTKVDLPERWHMVFVTDGVTEIAPGGNDFGSMGLDEMLGRYQPDDGSFDLMVDRWKALAGTSGVRDDATILQVGADTVGDSLRLRFDSTAETIATARQACVDWWTLHGVSPADMRLLELGVDEVLTNIHRHGYESRGGAIRLRAFLAGDEACLSVEHDGTPPAPSFRPAEPDRLPGGRGMHVIEKVFDSVQAESVRPPWKVFLRKRLTGVRTC